MFGMLVGVDGDEGDRMTRPERAAAQAALAEARGVFAVAARLDPTLASVLAENDAAGRVANYEYRHLPDDLRTPIDAMRVQIRMLVRDVIQGGVDDGSFDVPDANVAARALISLCVDISRWYSEEER